MNDNELVAKLRDGVVIDSGNIPLGPLAADRIEELVFRDESWQAGVVASAKTNAVLEAEHRARLAAARAEASAWRDVATQLEAALRFVGADWDEDQTETHNRNRKGVHSAALASYADTLKKWETEK